MARVYVEIVRNTPMLVQLYLVYFVLAPILDMDRFAAAVLALAIFEGAFAAEIFRAGIEAIPRGQWESGEHWTVAACGLPLRDPAAGRPFDAATADRIGGVADQAFGLGQRDRGWLTRTTEWS